MNQQPTTELSTFLAPFSTCKLNIHAHPIRLEHHASWITTPRPVLAREDGAYITSDPSNALIEGEVCVGPFIVMESVGNCPVTQTFFFIVAPPTHHLPIMAPRPWPSVSKASSSSLPACVGFWKSWGREFWDNGCKFSTADIPSCSNEWLHPVFCFL